MILIIFMNYSKEGMTIHDVITNFVKPGDSLSKKADDDDQLDKLISSEMEDAQYYPTQGEILGMFTLCKNVEEFKSTCLAGGLPQVYNNRSIKGKIAIMVGSYTIALGVLIAYAIIVYKHTVEKTLGPVTAVAVVTTDLILFCLLRCKLSNGPL